MTTNIAIEKFFGDGVYQDEKILIIQKSSLSIAPSANNTAESLLGAILFLASQATKAQITANSQGITINEKPLIINNNFAHSVTAELWDEVLFPTNKIRHTFLLYSWSLYGN